MKKAIFALALGMLFASAYANSQPASCTLTLNVDGFRNQKGDLGVTIFTSAEGWPEHNEKAFRHGAYPFSGEKTTVKLELPPGKYAVAVLHDENSNHKLDRNFLGIPKEGFGFSNNPKVRLSAPNFPTTAVDLVCPATELSIHLDYK